MMKAIWKRRNSDEGGFTLVELLVVIAILGILAGVAVFAIGGTTKKSKRRRASLTSRRSRRPPMPTRHQQAPRHRPTRSLPRVAPAPGASLLRRSSQPTAMQSLMRPAWSR